MFHFILRTVPRPILIQLSLIFSKIAPIIYYGNKYEDPISGKTYRKFLPYGYSGRAKRNNVLCPGSLSLERHRLLWLYLKEKTDSLQQNIKYCTLLPNSAFISCLKQCLTSIIQPAITTRPLPISTSICTKHLLKITASMLFLQSRFRTRRRCQPVYKRVIPYYETGWFWYFQIPQDVNRYETYEDKSITSEKDREIHFWQKDHVRLFGLDYKDKLAAAGFKVTVEDYTNKLRPNW